MNKLTNTSYIPGQVLLADDMTAIATKINEIVDAINTLQTEVQTIKTQLSSQESLYLSKKGGTISGNLAVTGNMKAKYYEQTGA